MLDFHHGDVAAVEAAFAKAAHVTKLAIRNYRVVVWPMEPRSALGSTTRRAERWTLRVGSPGRVRHAATLAGPLKAWWRRSGC